MLLCIFLEAAYLYAVTQLRASVSDAGRVRRTQVARFSAGVLVIYLAAGTPMHDVSENYLLSAHMLQHSLFTLVASAAPSPAPAAPAAPPVTTLPARCPVGTGTILLRVGCLDTPIKERPKVHIWRSDAASWFDPGDQLPEWPEGKAPPS